MKTFANPLGPAFLVEAALSACGGGSSEPVISKPVFLGSIRTTTYDGSSGTGAALPASQVVRTVPRGGVAGKAPALTLANLPAIASVPTVANAIVLTPGFISVPQ